MGLTDVTWEVEAIPRLSTRGTRRSLVTNFKEMSVDSVPLADDDSMGERWKAGPIDNSRWHPEGACIRFRFILSSGSYAFQADEINLDYLSSDQYNSKKAH